MVETYHQQVEKYLRKKLNFEFTVSSVRAVGKDVLVKINTEDGERNIILRESNKKGRFRITVTDL